ncbi:hypothetical protein QWY77_08835 [Thalassotalea ponticola]|uniref:hypothetical protein n=1 Tax=Thalassotalea ponticola TaxID=1523392 RepID=UPI0025B3B99D|nr:hypothetical protein [Thalassotalea ponticola]MDN3652867.1 hypothetical protein [Thalassotalea ponticola]
MIGKAPVLFAVAIAVSLWPLTGNANSQAQHQFFQSLTRLCGQAFSGQVITDSSDSENFANKQLIMHVRQCSENAIAIPFYVGDDASRTWLITKTNDGLQLKHDHRHKDGTADKLTMYGGITEDDGWPQLQSFVADDDSKQLFVEMQLFESIDNTWRIAIYPERFSYQLVRSGRVFRVDFDLTKPIPPPPPPWGH